MKTIFKMSLKNKVKLWIISSIPLILFLSLLLTSGNTVQAILPVACLLILVCYLVPILASFFVYVTIDENTLTIPVMAFFRKSIPVMNIQELHYRPHGAGLFGDIEIEYKNKKVELKKVLLPTFSVFGGLKTSKIIRKLSLINPAIKIDAEITKHFKKNRNED